MRIEIELDRELVEAVRKLGRYKSASAAVNAALKDYLERRRQAQVIGLFGKIDYDPTYDYKAERQARGSAEKSRS